LEIEGHTVQAVDNGALALKAFAQEKFDAILMDVEMPEMDGLEATRRIREIEAAEGRMNIPIVAMTAHAVDGFERQCQQAGMDGYITKPIEPTQLFDTLRVLTRRGPVVTTSDDDLTAAGVSCDASH